MMSIPMLAPNPPSGPSLWRELADGSAGPVPRLFVNMALAIASIGLVSISAFALAAIVPSWGHNYGSRINPSDELVLSLSVIAAGFFLVATVWLWSRRGTRWRIIIRPTIYTVVIAVITIVLCFLVDNSLGSSGEFLLFGIIFLAISGVIVSWVPAIYYSTRGRPLMNQSDGLPAIHCPACNYRMVGLHESRCPECGTSYTLDELLAKQDFIRTSSASPRTAEEK